MELASAAMSDSTNRQYERSWKLYVNFQGQLQFRKTSIPIREDDLVAFVCYLHSEGCKHSIIASHLSALAFVHRLYNVPCYTDNFVVRKLLMGSKHLRPSVDTRLPLTSDILRRLVRMMGLLADSEYQRVLFVAMFILAQR